MSVAVHLRVDLEDVLLRDGEQVVLVLAGVVVVVDEGAGVFEELVVVEREDLVAHLGEQGAPTLPPAPHLHVNVGLDARVVHLLGLAGEVAVRRVDAFALAHDRVAGV